MKIFLSILLLNTFLSFSQINQNTYEPPKRLVLKEDGWFTISLGTTILASSYFIHFNYDANGVKKGVRNGGLIFATTIGVGLHIISWEVKPKRRSIPKFY